MGPVNQGEGPVSHVKQYDVKRGEQLYTKYHVKQGDGIVHYIKSPSGYSTPCNILRIVHLVRQGE